MPESYMDNTIAQSDCEAMFHFAVEHISVLGQEFILLQAFI